MTPVNVYDVLQAVLESISPGNRASPFHFLCPPARRVIHFFTLHLVPNGRSALHLRYPTVSDEAVEKLGVLFSEQLLLAALDLIDRDCGKQKKVWPTITPSSPPLFSGLLHLPRPHDESHV
jgi:hypothetical protein